MTLKAKAKVASRTIGFWIGVAVTVFGAVQTSLSFLQPIVSPKVFGFANFAVGVIAMTLKFVEAKVIEPDPCVARDHDGTDEGSQ